MTPMASPRHSTHSEDHASGIFKKSTICISKKIYQKGAIRPGPEQDIATFMFKI
jgi:hypothetical protein